MVLGRLYRSGYCKRTGISKGEKTGWDHVDRFESTSALRSAGHFMLITASCFGNGGIRK